MSTDATPKPEVSQDAPGAWESLKEAPVSWGSCLAWILVFAAMLAWQGGFQGGDMVFAGVAPHVGHMFGDQRPADIAAGQLWRTLTSTFVHFSVLHIGFNLFMMYQLAPVLESWYGSRLFLGVYVAIGVLGNLLGGLGRLAVAAIRSAPATATALKVECGGGSSVICGLIALLAVVGWRSKTRFGDFLRAQMIAFLVFVGILGAVVTNIDNFGHAGGAIVGALLGFLHRPMLRMARGPKATAVAVVAGLVAVACVGLQVRAGVRESVVLRMAQRRERAKQREALRATYNDLLNVGEVYDLAEAPVGKHPGHVVVWSVEPRNPELTTFEVRTQEILTRQPGDFARVVLAASHERLARARGLFRGSDDQRRLDRLLELIRDAARRTKTPEEASEFPEIFPPLLEGSRTRLLEAGARLTTTGVSPFSTLGH